MHACDIRQYLIRQNVFCTILPRFTLTNNLSHTVISYDISSYNNTLAIQITIMHACN